MTFTQSISTVFSNYANFNGRASRSQFWWWYLFGIIISCLFGIAGGPDVQNWPIGLYIINCLVCLAMILPSIAVTVRRLHDIGKGGGWIFIALVPLIGTIWFIVLMVMPSQQGSNRFGQMPE